MSMNIKTFCTVLRSESLRYKQKHKELTKKYKEDIENVEKTYIKDTPPYKAILETLKKNYDESIRDMRLECTKIANDMVTELKAIEKNRIGKVDEAKLAKIRAIQDMSLSVEELEVLAGIYNADGDYWASRALMEIAEKNGIDGFAGVMEAPYSTKLSVINDLANQFSQIITNYPSQFRDEQTKLEYVYLNEDIINRAELIYKGRISAVDSELSARKAWSAMLSKPTAVERAGCLSNILKNAKGEMKDELLLHCCLQDGVTITADVLEMSGFAEDVKQFKEKGVANYQRAKNLVYEIVTADETAKKSIAIDNKDNPFLGIALKRESEKRSDSTLYDLGDLVDGITVIDCNQTA